MTRGRGGDDGGGGGYVVLLWRTRARGIRVSTVYLNGVARPPMPNGDAAQFETMVCKGGRVLVIWQCRAYAEAWLLHRATVKRANISRRCVRARAKKLAHSAIGHAVAATMRDIAAALLRELQKHEGANDG